MARPPDIGSDSHNCTANGAPDKCTDRSSDQKSDPAAHEANGHILNNNVHNMFMPVPVTMLSVFRDRVSSPVPGRLPGGCIVPGVHPFSFRTLDGVLKALLLIVRGSGLRLQCRQDRNIGTAGRADCQQGC